MASLTHGPLSDRIRAAAIARAERRADAASVMTGIDGRWSTVPASPWVARAIARTLPPKELAR